MNSQRYRIFRKTIQGPPSSALAVLTNWVAMEAILVHTQAGSLHSTKLQS